MTAYKKPAKPPLRRPVSEYIEEKASMLDSIPVEYGKVVTAQDAVEAAFPAEDRAVRVFIIWDNTVGNFPLEEVLDHMRETGAAMVWKVEPIR